MTRAGTGKPILMSLGMLQVVERGGGGGGDGHDGYADYNEGCVVETCLLNMHAWRSTVYLDHVVLRKAKECIKIEEMGASMSCQGFYGWFWR